MINKFGINQGNAYRCDSFGNQCQSK